MIIFLKKYRNPISFVALLVVLWQFPTTPHAISVTFLLPSLTIAIVFIFRKHKEAFLQGKVSHGVFVRNTFLEIFGILLAMTLAGLLGRYIAQIATQQISNELTKLLAGVLLGLLAGVGIGLLLKRVWGSFVKI